MPNFSAEGGGHYSDPTCENTHVEQKPIFWTEGWQHFHIICEKDDPKCYSWEFGLPNYLCGFENAATE